MINVTLYLHTPLGSSLYNFRLNYEWYWYSGTLSDAHHSSMLLVINMDIRTHELCPRLFNCCIITVQPQ